MIVCYKEHYKLRINDLSCFFFLSELCKVQHISYYNLLRKTFSSKAQEEKVLGIAGVDATQYHYFVVYFYHWALEGGPSAQ